MEQISLYSAVTSIHLSLFLCESHDNAMCLCLIVKGCHYS